MAESRLVAVSPLAGFSQMFADTRLWESHELAIIAVAVPDGGRDELDEQLQALCQQSFPAPGTSLRSNEKSINGLGASLALFGLQQDQCLLVLEPDQQSTEQVISHVHTALEQSAYLTDQSDSFAVLEIKGSLAQAALERLCMLDLSSFDSTKVARTAMEHLAVIIDRPGSEHFRLYAPRSSARSFLHIITTALSGVDYA